MAWSHVLSLLLLLTSCLHGGSSKGMVFTTTPGLSLSGHDYQPAVTTTTRSLCAVMCHFAADAGCNAAQYDQLTGSCQLKTRIHLSAVQPAPTTTSFMYYAPPGFKLVVQGMRSGGFDVTQSHSGSFSLYRGAEISCIVDPDCTGFVYKEWENGDNQFFPKYFLNPPFISQINPDIKFMAIYIIAELDDFERFSDKACADGNDLMPATTGAYHRQCMLSCHSEPACEAYTWDLGALKCYLKSVCDTVSDRPATITGRKYRA